STPTYPSTTSLSAPKTNSTATNSSNSSFPESTVSNYRWYGEFTSIELRSNSPRSTDLVPNDRN
ncbi:unnamed protein product, partial [Ceratitis capitata]